MQWQTSRKLDVAPPASNVASKSIQQGHLRSGLIITYLSANVNTFSGK